MISIYEERGEKRGILKGHREALLILLQSKFGTIPDTVIKRVEKIKKTEELKNLTSKVLIANSLEDMGLTEN
jgi:hypothetical protein